MKKIQQKIIDKILILDKLKILSNSEMARAFKITYPTVNQIIQKGTHPNNCQSQLQSSVSPDNIFNQTILTYYQNQLDSERKTRIEKEAELKREKETHREENSCKDKEITTKDKQINDLTNQLKEKTNQMQEFNQKFEHFDKQIAQIKDLIENKEKSDGIGAEGALALTIHGLASFYKGYQEESKKNSSYSNQTVRPGRIINIRKLSDLAGQRQNKMPNMNERMGTPMKKDIHDIKWVEILPLSKDQLDRWNQSQKDKNKPTRVL